MSPESPRKSLLRVCLNERFGSYRDMESDLGEVARAVLHEDWLPSPGDLDAFHKFSCAQLAFRRAGYLLELLAGWAQPGLQQRLTDIVDTIRLMLDTTSFQQQPFYHADICCQPCFDEIAVKWGFCRGLNISRLMQLLEPPYVV